MPKKNGGPRSVLQTLYSTILKMRHYVQTGHGESTSFYTALENQNLQGGGQGNGSGPPTRICISIVLISIINTFPVNATFTSAMSGLEISLCAIMYIDNTDLLVTGEYHNDYISVGKRPKY